MPRISAEREEATRRAILRSARNAFVLRGFHEATTHDVARDAGLSVGSIYTYFASKDDLIHESVLAANQAETETIIRAVQSTGSVREKLARAIDGWYDYTLVAPGVPAFLAEAWAAATRKPLIRDLIARRRERTLTVASMILQEGVAAGELAPDLDVPAAARAITAMLDGIVLETIGSGAPPSRLEVRRRTELIVGL